MSDVTRCAADLKAGQIIAYPSEGVMGLGVRADQPEAIEALLALKGRSPSKGFILVAAHSAQLTAYVDSESLAQALRLHWPEAVSFVLPAGAGCSDLITGGRDSVAVRISTHPVLRALCIACGQALISTSANLSGQRAVRNAKHIDPALTSQLASVCEGEVGGLSGATPIWDTIGQAWLR